MYKGAASAEYIAYHDNEWGVPEHDDTKLFELLILEGAQVGYQGVRVCWWGVRGSHLAAKLCRALCLAARPSNAPQIDAAALLQLLAAS
jgi:hypothetical protein